MMNGLIIALAIILAIIGLLGAILPGLPGTPLSYAALLVLLLLPSFEANVTFLVIMAVVAVFITILDYVIPIYGTKKFGGTKLGVRGSTIGLVVSVFVLPLLGITIGPFGILGLLLGPFVGAYLGEMAAGNKDNAMKAAIGSFVGFVAGTFIKVIYAILVVVFVFVDSWGYIF